jgi:hypothetical protein
MLRTTTVLEGKDIDAAILPDPLAAFALAEGANVVIDDTTLGVNLSQSVVAVTSEAIDENQSRPDVRWKLSLYDDGRLLYDFERDSQESVYVNGFKINGKEIETFYAELLDTYGGK